MSNRSGWDVEAWVRAATARYPEIESVHLVGSRVSQHTARPDSDWDLAICLADACYDAGFRPVDDAEHRLAGDPALFFEGLDLFFLRPEPPLTAEDVRQRSLDTTEYPARCLWGKSSLVSGVGSLLSRAALPDTETSLGQEERR